VTWAVDPLLVQDAEVMRAGYRVGTGSERRTGSGQAAARTWLTQLGTAVGHGAVLGLPYADPDVVAAVRAGLTGDVQLASTLGQTLLSQALNTATLPYAWPAGGFSDQRTLDTLFASGVTTVVLDSTALPVVGGDQSLTPGAHATATTRDGTLDAVLVDHVLSTAIDDAAADPASGVLASQRVLSELLMIQAERPGLPREVVLAPDRRWDPTPALAQRLVAATGRVPWIAPVPLGQVVAAPVYDAVTRGPVSYPSEARTQELRRGYLRSTVPVKNRLAAFTDVLPVGDPQGRQFEDGLLRLLSSAWRTDQVAADGDRQQLSDALQSRMQEVRITTHPDSLITLTGSNGTVPITVANNLDTPVRVAVVAVADPHLELRAGSRATRTIPAHTQLPVDLRVTARTRGVSTLTVSLFTPEAPADSRRYSPAVTLRVNSTAYGLEALIITGGATAVLFVGAGVRLGRRARAARRAARAGA
jgi:hypothetical protein